ncbi:MAG: hypothetical protein Q9222_002068 [Ikaeria aurantiellina]
MSQLYQSSVDTLDNASSSSQPLTSSASVSSDPTISFGPSISPSPSKTPGARPESSGVDATKKIAIALSVPLAVIVLAIACYFVVQQFRRSVKAKVKAGGLQARDASSSAGARFEKPELHNDGIHELDVGAMPELRGESVQEMNTLPNPNSGHADSDNCGGVGLPELEARGLDEARTSGGSDDAGA